jgi:pimeloyl-ACP methyl ester carboxylesterase
MSVQLDPFGGVVEVGSVRLRTPGLQGEAESHPAASPGMRAAALTTDDFEQGLANEGVEPQETVELGGTAEIDAGATGTRSTAHDEAAIELEAPAPGEGLGQMVLYIDEAGVMRWSFAEQPEGDAAAMRGSATRTYLVPRTVPPAPDAAATRGLAGIVGKKLLKVLVFPLVDKVVGEVGKHFAGRWEAKKRPYRVRTFTPSNYTSVEADALDGEGWRRLGQGPALLLVHGTFSRAHTAFGGLPAAYVEQLHDRYDGRVFAFDHFTLSEDPRRNVERLIDTIPDGTNLELDVIAHSRGGLVGRLLAEQAASLALGSRKVEVRKLVFVATPNAGTRLADAEHMGDLVDTYTNLLNFVPDTGVVEVLEAVVTVTKQLAVGVLQGLDGLRSMVPDGDFLKALNAGGGNGRLRYFALTSDYEPPELGLRTFRDVVMDRIFGAENDLVVPTLGVYDENGSGMFPIADPQVFPSGSAIAHSAFFADQTARDRILAWLGG